MGSTVIPVYPGAKVIKFNPGTKLVDDPYFVEGFHKEMLEASKNVERVVLDFRNIKFLGASILSELITFHRSDEKTLVLAGLHDQPLERIEQTKLHSGFFNIEKSIPETSNVYQFTGKFERSEKAAAILQTSYPPISKNRIKDLFEEGYPVKQGNEITFKFKETKFNEDCLKPHTLRDDILSMVESGITLVILDLENVSFIGEDDIGQLITLNKALYKRTPKAKIIIANPQENVFESLKCKKLHSLFCPTESVS